MLDAVTLERKGVPTVTLAYDTFVGAARSYARIAGVPSAPVVPFQHWEPDMTTDMAREEAKGLAGTVMAHITR